MSSRKEKLMSLSHAQGIELGTDKLRETYSTYLSNGMHGLCFSLYEEGQKPGDIISEEQIRRRIEIIKPYTKCIRTFSCTEGNVGARWGIWDKNEKLKYK